MTRGSLQWKSSAVITPLPAWAIIFRGSLYELFKSKRLPSEDMTGNKKADCANASTTKA
jgi:hypothetical protein